MKNNKQLMILHRNKKYLIIIVILFLYIFTSKFLLSKIQAQQEFYDCGEQVPTKYLDRCICSGPNEKINDSTHCCGWMKAGSCVSVNPKRANEEGGISIQHININTEILNQINPLVSEDSTAFGADLTLGSIVNRLFTFAFPIAGLLLFVYIIWGGFEIIMGASNQQNIDQGKKRVTAAIVGFIILFSIYWIAQILEQVFDMPILG